MKEPKVIKVPIKGLIFDPDNPNKMSPEDYRQLVTNIKAAGVMLQPILVQEGDDGFPIVDGNHRAKASEEAGLTHVLAVVWDGTEEMRRAMSVSFNKIRGELDLSAVQRIVTELAEAGWSTTSLTATGYSEQEITDLLAVATDVDPDAVMEQPHALPTDDDDTPKQVRPLILELTFASKEALDKARRGLRRAAGKGRELGDGLLTLLEEQG